jgi:uncharacterized protein (DUF2384 family)
MLNDYYTQMSSELSGLLRCPKNPAVVADVSGLLGRLVRAYGRRAVAEMLGVDAATVRNWLRASEIDARARMRIIDLHDVINRALQVFSPKVAADWFGGSEPLLDGARPIDVLKTSGALRIIKALDGREAGVYA